MAPTTIPSKPNDQKLVTIIEKSTENPLGNCSYGLATGELQRVADATRAPATRYSI